MFLGYQVQISVEKLTVLAVEFCGFHKPLLGTCHNSTWNCFCLHPFKVIIYSQSSGCCRVWILALLLNELLLLLLLLLLLILSYLIFWLVGSFPSGIVASHSFHCCITLSSCVVVNILEGAISGKKAVGRPRLQYLTFNVRTFKCLVLPCWPDFFGHLKLEIAGLHKNRYIFCSI